MLPRLASSAVVNNAPDCGGGCGSCALRSAALLLALLAVLEYPGLVDPLVSANNDRATLDLSSAAAHGRCNAIMVACALLALAVCPLCAPCVARCVGPPVPAVWPPCVGPLCWPCVGALCGVIPM